MEKEGESPGPITEKTSGRKKEEGEWGRHLERTPGHASKRKFRELQGKRKNETGGVSRRTKTFLIGHVRLLGTHATSRLGRRREKEGNVEKHLTIKALGFENQFKDFSKSQTECGRTGTRKGERSPRKEESSSWCVSSTIRGSWKEGGRGGR